ncbi:hypothetical protein LEMLEM_LOCUS19970 [Lemmus lemmus]
MPLLMKSGETWLSLPKGISSSMRWDYSYYSPGIRKRLKVVNDAETNEDVLATETRRTCFTNLHALFSPWSNIYELLWSRSSTLLCFDSLRGLVF